MAKGQVHGVGVGPGDPELITLKAFRVIQECPVIAVPGNIATKSLAYQTALAAIPEVATKELLALPSPMAHDPKLVTAEHYKNAKALERYLDAGQDVALLTLGDPSIYSTFGYLRRALETDGYHTSTVSGVPSFCAAAARLGISLAEDDDSIHVLPANVIVGTQSLDADGTYVIMKAGTRAREIKTILNAANLDAQAIERCSMDGERSYPSLKSIPDDASYLTLVIASHR